MTTHQDVLGLPKSDWREKVHKALAAALYTTLSAVGAKTRPTVQHFRTQLYTWAGFCFISAASFYHSIFTGLLVTGIGWFVFEWKVSDNDSDS